MKPGFLQSAAKTSIPAVSPSSTLQTNVQTPLELDDERLQQCLELLRGPSDDRKYVVAPFKVHNFSPIQHSTLLFEHITSQSS